MAADQETVDRVRSIDVDAYKYGFVSAIESDLAPKGLSEDTVRFISAKKGEPEWLLEWRLDAFRRWRTMEEPKWARVSYPPIDYQDIYYFAAPKAGPAPKSLDEVDPELLRTYAKLGIPLVEQEILAGVEKPRVAVDAVFELRFDRDHLQGRARQGRGHFLLVLRGGARSSRSRTPIPRHRRAEHGQLLRHPQFGGVFRRLVRLCAARCALPDGALDLFPHQRTEHRAVRAHVDHRRPGRLCELPRRLHRAEAGREPASRRGGRIDHARRRGD